MSGLFYGGARAVFFDLDGTLADTAPDMVAALQALQRDAGITPMDYDLGRSQVSNGAVGLLTTAFPDETITLDSALLCDFIGRYKARVCDETGIFPGLNDLLQALEHAAVPWGVVTNKPEHLTHPILETLGLAERSVSIVCGDTLPTRKPDPATLLLACEHAARAPEDCIYVGDASRDIEAGKNAGMGTIAVGYGYIAAEDDPRSWQADQYAENVAELVQIVRKAVNLDN